MTQDGTAEKLVPAAAKAAVDFATLTARLKPRPFKTKSTFEFFRSL
jgi:hypothetical protein